MKNILNPEKFTMTNKMPLIIAHRGASYDAPENTMVSVKLAWLQNADAVEVDVHKTKDNHILVIHDPDTLRTTRIKKIIREENLNSIRKLDAGKWKNSTWNGVYIPTLKEVLQTVPADKKIFIEIKSGDSIGPIQKLMKQSHLQPDQFVFMDFDLNTIIEAGKVFIQSEILWLYEFFPHLKKHEFQNTFNMIIEKALSAKANGINIEFNSFIDQSFIKKVHDLKMKFYTWTVNDIENAKKLKKWNIDGITTDRPGYLKENL